MTPWKRKNSIRLLSQIWFVASIHLYLIDSQKNSWCLLFSKHQVGRTHVYNVFFKPILRSKVDSSDVVSESFAVNWLSWPFYARRKRRWKRFLACLDGLSLPHPLRLPHLDSCLFRTRKQYERVKKCLRVNLTKRKAHHCLSLSSK